MSGFLSVPFDTPDLIIYRENVVFKNDIFMMIAQIAVIIVLLMVTPVKYTTYRLAVLNLVTGEDTLTMKKYIIDISKFLGM